MPTILFDSPIFGPIHSRRLGLSLGLNLMPADEKICSFDCIYCECGLNKPKEASKTNHLPKREQIQLALETKLRAMMQAGTPPDTLTFAGNGEPTGHPHFAEIVNDVMSLRDKYCPKAKISVLTNATHIRKKKVFDALLRVDNALLKLDTVDADYIALVDRPNGPYPLDKLIEQMKAFNGQAMIQTMFLKGCWQGVDVDNTKDKYVLPWLIALQEIAPKAVTIYTIERETPGHDLRKAEPEVLDRIAARVRSLGIECTVSY